MNQNIFVVYPSAKLGDFIWHVPFIKHISDISNKKVILITRKSTSAHDILSNEDYIKNIHYIPFKKGLFNYIREILLMRKLFRKFKAKEVWILDKISRPAIAAKLSNIKTINGFGVTNQKLWITNKNSLDRKDLKIHYIERSKKFFNLLNKPIDYKFTNIHIKEDLINILKKELTPNNEKIITYGIDSSEMWRSWPKEYFSDLVLKINKEDNCKHILIASPQNSKIAVDIINRTKLKNIFNYSHLKIIDIMPLLKISNIYIGNDSGILNLSAAIGVKSIGIFGATKSFNYSNNIIPVISEEGEISSTSDRLLDNKGKTIEDPKLAKEGITQLSNVLRNSLLMGSQKLISLADEMKLVNDYLGLEKTRFEERLTIKRNVDERTLMFLLPPMMLQTLVENGIKHGTSQLPEGGIIEIHTSLEKDNLKIVIYNSGVYDETAKPETGFGVVNTVQRLKLLYGEKAVFKIENEDNRVKTLLLIPNETIL